jgi:ribosome modulation factor
MISIIKEGRAAYVYGGNPSALCPYKEPLSREQLAWSVGWYKAQADSVSKLYKDLREGDIIVNALIHAELRGARDYSPNYKYDEVCPYRGTEYTGAYVKGWFRGKAQYELKNGVKDET